MYYFCMILLPLFFFTGCSMPAISLFPGNSSALEEYVLEGSGKEKILVISVQGKITDRNEKSLLRSEISMVQRIVSQLRKAEKDKYIKGLILKVDSPGGSVTASDILYHEILEFRQRTGVKILAVFMNLAASGAYYISLPADRIMAHPTTICGSVGVIIIRPEVSGLMQKLGIAVSVSKTGKQKDMGSPFRKTGQEEEKIFQKLAEDLGTRFLELVKKHRHPDADALRQIAEAGVFLAEDALELGLVDEIAYLGDAVKRIQEMTGIPEDASIVCYRRREYPDDNIYNTAAQSGIGTVSLISLPLSVPAAGFYYLWPPAAQE
ncbi:MAG: signal peptide peptidase SppA [Desulfococcaceae bacterium]|nr:signal peptide peptidase SppA [Desulfococcaceae bacterium]